jgi:hypothetical protein
MPPQNSDEKVSFWKQKTFWLLFLVVVFSTVYLLANNFYQAVPPQSQSIELSHSTSVATSSYYTNIENIKLTVPKRWTGEDTTKLPPLPVGFNKPIFAFQKVGTTCLIVEAKWIVPVPVAVQKQISFADRVYTDYAQFDGDWYVASTSEASQYSFSGGARQHIPADFRVSRDARHDPFILFTSDGSSVLDECNDDFNTLLMTVEPYYETVHLTPASKGVLTTEKVWDDNTQGLVNKSYEHLLFTADGSQERREVMRIPQGTWAEKFSVSGGKLYVPANGNPYAQTIDSQLNAVINVLDPFTGEMSEIPGTAKSDTYISSLYLRGGDAYYLSNNSTLGWCLEGYHNCPASLYSVPLGGGTPALVATTSVGGSILGYVESEGAFYISQYWGDAGCSSTSISKVIGGKEDSTKVYGGCYDESNTQNNDALKEMDQTVGALTAKAEMSKLLAQGIQVENGELLPVTGITTGYASFYFDK